ncbi:MAG: amino acid racemase [Cyclobacteriaceae bacterium]
MSDQISYSNSKRIGIVAHSYEGGSLCFLTACQTGASLFGAHMHPNIVMSAIPMGLSMPGWEEDNHDEVAKYLLEGINQVADAGADFFICPDNTAHIVLEKVIDKSPIPGLHIAQVVGHQIKLEGWKNVGLLGTKWTMTGSVYANALKSNNLNLVVPNKETRGQINAAIFDELCQGIFGDETVELFHKTINNLRERGAECVILGCTEIPLIVSENSSSLPVLDSTRLLARQAVKIAASNTRIQGPWVELTNVGL